MKNHRKLVVGFILIVIVVIFSVINTEKVTVSFGLTHIQSPLIFIILGSTILGALIVFITLFSGYWNQRKEVKVLENQVAIYQTELTQKVEEALSVERELFEAELRVKQERIDELEQQFNELSGATFLDVPTLTEEEV